jgi:hemolysin III
MADPCYIAIPLSDHGPCYAETDLTRFPVEPWATWTNLVFLCVIVYWTWRLRGCWRRHRMLSIAALPLLTIGWLGGTIYHATRSHVIWLLLDWVPIVLLIMLAAGWLWLRLTHKVIFAVGITVAMPLILGALLTHALAHAGPAGISASYAIMGSSVVIPAALNCVRQRRAWLWLAAVIVCFAAALAFRTCDMPLARAGWPHGSHYLWHVFGGLATFLMFAFLYRLGETQGTRATGMSMT